MRVIAVAIATIGAAIAAPATAATKPPVIPAYVAAAVADASRPDADQQRDVNRKPAEVLAVEIKQFVGSGIQTLVPRVIGVRTPDVPIKPPPPVPIAEEDFLRSLAERQPRESQDVARAIIDWSRKQGLSDRFQKGRHTVFKPELVTDENCFCPLKLDDRGLLVILMQRMKSKSPFCEASHMAWYREHIRRLPGLIEQDGGVEGFPQLPLSELTSSDRIAKCLSFLTEMVRRLKADNSSEEQDRSVQ